MRSEIGFLCNVIVWLICAAASDVDYGSLYEGAQVWRTVLRGPTDLETLEKLSENDDISLWNIKSYMADFLVKHENIMKVLETFRTTALEHNILILDVQSRVTEQKTTSVLWDENALRNGHRLSWDRYPTLEIINEYLASLIQGYPSICTMHQVGKSVQNKTIKGVKVSNGNPKNEGIVLVSGFHAREWAAITSLLYVINNVVTKFDQQPDYIKNKDWYFIPVLNPDGFVFSYKRDRLWRKNRRPVGGCIGVDLNRNFGLDWGLKYREPKRCAASFAGAFPFSEPESDALRTWFLKLNKKPKAFVDIHSYGQQIMFPWSARELPTRDRDQNVAVARGMAKAIKAISDEPYTYGDTYHLVYPATGTAMDWVYSTGVPHTYGIEVRDLGKHGFLLPASHIEDVGMDVLVAVRYLAKYMTQSSRRTTNSTDEWF